MYEKSNCLRYKRFKNDQRVNRSALTLYENGYNVTVVGQIKNLNFKAIYNPQV